MKYVDAVLWRNYNKATYDTLEGNSRGQYDIRLGSTLDLERFFQGEPHFNETALGGFDLHITLEGLKLPPEELPEAAAAEDYRLTVRYMGDSSRRRDWNIPSQRPSTAYCLWKQPGRYPGRADDRSYLILIRTTDGKYYGRILPERETASLPAVLAMALAAQKETGMIVLDCVRASGQAEKIYEQLMEHKNLLLYGPPGTGKTTLMQEAVQIFNHGGISQVLFDETKTEDFFSYREAAGSSRTAWTTFHQSYSYEEFIIGMTTEGASGKLLDIRPRQGKLLELSEFARKKGSRGLLVIDELNRANVSRVFGEFITIMEPDKRLDAEGNVTEKTVGIQLPYLKDGQTFSFVSGGETFAVSNPFYMPSEVYTIASMNSVDKSVFPLDSALRRRFYRYDLYPDLKVLEQHFGVEGREYEPMGPEGLEGYSMEQFKILVKDFMTRVNEKITLFMGADYTLGQSYVWRLADTDEAETGIRWFRRALFEQILPQLEEMFRGREEQLLYILGCGQNEGPYLVTEPSEEEMDLGAVRFVTVNREGLLVADMVRWLERTV